VCVCVCVCVCVLWQGVLRPYHSYISLSATPNAPPFYTSETVFNSIVSSHHVPHPCISRGQAFFLYLFLSLLSIYLPIYHISVLGRVFWLSACNLEPYSDLIWTVPPFLTLSSTVEPVVEPEPDMARV
jgi:hypothetical protein